MDSLRSFGLSSSEGCTSKRSGEGFPVASQAAGPFSLADPSMEVLCSLDRKFPHQSPYAQYCCTDSSCQTAKLENPGIRFWEVLNLILIVFESCLLCHVVLESPGQSALSCALITTLFADFTFSKCPLGWLINNCRDSSLRVLLSSFSSCGLSPDESNGRVFASLITTLFLVKYACFNFQTELPFGGWLIFNTLRYTVVNTMWIFQYVKYKGFNGRVLTSFLTPLFLVKYAFFREFQRRWSYYDKNRVFRKILNFDFNGSGLMIRYATQWAMEKSLFLITPHFHSIDPDKNCLGRIVVASSDASLECITNNNHNLGSLAVVFLNVANVDQVIEGTNMTIDMENELELSTGQT